MGGHQALGWSVVATLNLPTPINYLVTHMHTAGAALSIEVAAEEDQVLQDREGGTTGYSYGLFFGLCRPD